MNGGYGYKGIFGGHGRYKHYPEASVGGLQYGSEDSKRDTSPQNNSRRYRDQTSTDIIKQKKQQKIANDDIKIWQQRKLEMSKEMAEEKKRDLDMLKDYRPWGKPSGGAPRVKESGSVDARHQGLHWSQHEPELTEDGETPFGRAGGGAPRKSDSGRIITTLQRDPDTRFQKHLRREVDNTLRYSKENRQGDSSVITGLPEPSGKQPRSSIEEDAVKRAQTLKYSRRLEEQIMEQRERKLRDISERKKAQSIYDPFGKDVPKRDSSGNVVRQLHHPLRKQKEEGKSNQSSVLPLGSHSNVRTRRKFETKPNMESGENGYDPWGRPGGGAPMKDSKGQKLANRTGALGRENNSATTLLRKSQERKAYLDALRTDMHNQKDPQLSHSDSAGVEVAAWIRSGVVGNPPVDRQTGEFRGANRQLTDVIANKLSIRRQAGEEANQYYKDLQQQADERHAHREREKEQDREMTDRHLNALSKMWDAPQKKPPVRVPLEMDAKLKEERQKYYEELTAQQRNRNEAKMQQNRQDIEEERRHVEAYNQQWGRPGCGAPNQTSFGQHKYKSALDPSGNVLRRRS